MESDESRMRLLLNDILSTDRREVQEAMLMVALTEERRERGYREINKMLEDALRERDAAQFRAQVCETKLKMFTVDFLQPLKPMKRPRRKRK